MATELLQRRLPIFSVSIRDQVMKTPFKKISVIGLGYIGLPTAAILASRGIEVVGVDVDQDTIDIINRGEIHIVEPDLDAIVHAVVMTGRLRAISVPEEAEAFLLAVPTPVMEGHRPDLSYVKAGAQSVAPMLQVGNLVVLESTSPVGTTELVSQWLADSRPDLTFPHQAGAEADIQIAYCPERVLPGHILRELVQNDRVIGGLTPRCAERAASLYRLFVEGECVLTNARTAEMCKLTENAFRDVNIAFANELSVICEKLKINVWELIELANRHPRVDILKPGPGVGGHCIAVDPWFIVHSSPAEARLIRVARETNDAKPTYLVEQILRLGNDVSAPVIAFFGLTYKADTDDFRESPSLEIVRAVSGALRDQEILVVEPYIEELASVLAGHANVRLVTLEAALEAANIVVMLVDHSIFRTVTPDMLAARIVVDTRGCWTKT